MVVYWKLVLAGIQHRRLRAALSGLLIAVRLIPVLVAVGLGSHRGGGAYSAASAHGRISRRPTSESPALRPVYRPFVVLFLIVSAPITFAPMWAHVLRRKHEIGILRSLGGSKLLVIALVLSEAAAISLGGAIFAIPISQIMLTGISFLSAPAIPYSIGFGWCLTACGIVIGAAIGGSTIPCAASVQQDVLNMLEWD
jgi:putative ABC transport system permease protein